MSTWSAPTDEDASILAQLSIKTRAMDILDGIQIAVAMADNTNPVHKALLATRGIDWPESGEIAVFAHEARKLQDLAGLTTRKSAGLRGSLPLPRVGAELVKGQHP